MSVTQTELKNGLKLSFCEYILLDPGFTVLVVQLAVFTIEWWNINVNFNFTFTGENMSAACLCKTYFHNAQVSLRTESTHWSHSFLNRLEYTGRTVCFWSTNPIRSHSLGNHLDYTDGTFIVIHLTESTHWIHSFWYSWNKLVSLYVFDSPKKNRLKWIIHLGIDCIILIPLSFWFHQK